MEQVVVFKCKACQRDITPIKRYDFHPKLGLCNACRTYYKLYNIPVDKIIQRDITYEGGICKACERTITNKRYFHHNYQLCEACFTYCERHNIPFEQASKRSLRTLPKSFLGKPCKGQCGRALVKRGQGDNIFTARHEARGYCTTCLQRLKNPPRIPKRLGIAKLKKNCKQCGHLITKNWEELVRDMCGRCYKKWQTANKLGHGYRTHLMYESQRAKAIQFLGGKCMLCDDKTNLVFAHLHYKRGRKRYLRFMNEVLEHPDDFLLLCNDCHIHPERWLSLLICKQPLPPLPTNSHSNKHNKKMREVGRYTLGAKCQLCGASNNLHFAHIEYTNGKSPKVQYYLFKEVLANPSNFLLLCKQCHQNPEPWLKQIIESRKHDGSPRSPLCPIVNGGEE